MLVPDSLLSTYFQAKYFAQDNFLNASLGSRPSLVWRSLMWDKDLVLAGCGWRVGNVEKIRIWEDNWLPGHTHFKPITQKSPQYTLNKVYDLITPDMSWNSNLINDTFLPGDTEKFMATI